jgi:hypothetical protein
MLLLYSIFAHFSSARTKLDVNLWRIKMPLKKGVKALRFHKDCCRCQKTGQAIISCHPYRSVFLQQETCLALQRGKKLRLYLGPGIMPIVLGQNRNLVEALDSAAGLVDSMVSNGMIQNGGVAHHGGRHRERSGRSRGI